MTEKGLESLRHVAEETRLAHQENRIDDVMRGLREFDSILLEASKMKQLRSLVNSLQESLRSYRKINLSNPERRDQAVREHLEILAAVMARDTDRAEGLVRRHIQKARDSMLLNLAKHI